MVKMELVLRDSLGRAQRLLDGDDDEPVRIDLFKTGNGFELLPRPAGTEQPERSLAIIDVCPGSIWLSPLAGIVRLLPPSVQNLSELEKAWYSYAVPQDHDWKTRLYLRPGDSFDLGEDSVCFTVELRPQDRVEVTSSLPDISSPNKAGPEHNRESDGVIQLLDGSTDEKGATRNSIDVPQSLVASGQPQSPTAPSRNTLESVEETPHVPSRFHQDEMSLENSFESGSPSKAVARLETSAHLASSNKAGESLASTQSLSSSDDDAGATPFGRERTPGGHEKEASEVRQPLCQRDSNAAFIPIENTFREQSDYCENNVLPTKMGPGQEPQGSEERREPNLATTLPKEIEPAANERQDPQAYDLPKKGSDMEGKSADMNLAGDEELSGVAQMMATSKADSSKARKRKFEQAAGSTRAPPTKRGKAVHDESQDSVDSIIDITAHPKSANDRPRPQTSPGDSKDDSHIELQHVGENDNGTSQKSSDELPKSAKALRTYSKRVRNIAQHRGSRSSPRRNPEVGSRETESALSIEPNEDQLSGSKEAKKSKVENSSIKSSPQSIIAKPVDSQTRKSKRESQRATSTTSTPISSGRSIGSNTSTTASPYQGKSLKVVFSSNSMFADHVAFKNFLRKQGSTTGQHVSDKSDILCIGDGEVRKSVSLLLAVALGKQIVTDQWARQSQKAGHILDPVAFLPSDRLHEEEWKFKISEISGQPREDLFIGKTFYFTPTLKREYGTSGFKDIEEILRACGAASVISKVAKHLPENSDTIVLVSNADDADAAVLQKDHRPCFHKDLLSMSVLRGSLELKSSEFRINAGGAAQSRTRKRKIF
ncbi:MAG: hypothetical protein Q9165_006128 [Trypethelium subeluteriae]